MRLDRSQLVLVFFVILGIFYVVNIVNIYRTSSLLVESPVKLLFTVIVPDERQCSNCFDSSGIIDSIGKIDYVEVLGKKVFEPSNVVSKSLVKKYKIRNLPAIIISGNISDKRVVDMWKSLGGEKDGKNIVIQNLIPFYDLAQQKPKGIVEATLLRDEECQTCFKEDQYLQAIKRLGIAVSRSTVYDIGTLNGEKLVKKYAIKKVPSLILSPDAVDYPWFANVWEAVGTKEQDGWFVFREVQKMGEYEKI